MSGDQKVANPIDAEELAGDATEPGSSAPGAASASAPTAPLSVAGFTGCKFFEHAKTVASKFCPTPPEITELETREAFKAWLAERTAGMGGGFEGHTTSPLVWAGASEYVGGHHELLEYAAVTYNGGAAAWDCALLSTHQKARLTIGAAQLAVGVVLAVALLLSDADPAWRWTVALPVAGSAATSLQTLPCFGWIEMIVRATLAGNGNAAGTLKLLVLITIAACSGVVTGFLLANKVE